MEHGIRTKSELELGRLRYQAARREAWETMRACQRELDRRMGKEQAA